MCVYVCLLVHVCAIAAAYASRVPICVLIFRAAGMCAQAIDLLLKPCVPALSALSQASPASSSHSLSTTTTASLAPLAVSELSNNNNGDAVAPSPSASSSSSSSNSHSSTGWIALLTGLSRLLSDEELDYVVRDRAVHALFRTLLKSGTLVAPALPLSRSNKRRAGVLWGGWR